MEVKMEEQEILNLQTGEKEATQLKPASVKIVKVEIQTVGDKGNKKAVFSVKHPDNEEPIKISAVKYEQKGSLKTSGTWVNLDDEQKLRKGSALANFISYMQGNVLKDLEGKDVSTTEDEKGYLCFKAY